MTGTLHPEDGSSLPVPEAALAEAAVAEAAVGEAALAEAAVAEAAVGEAALAEAAVEERNGLVAFVLACCPLPGSDLVGAVLEVGLGCPAGGPVLVRRGGQDRASQDNGTGCLNQTAEEAGEQLPASELRHGSVSTGRPGEEVTGYVVGKRAASDKGQ